MLSGGGVDFSSPSLLRLHLRSLVQSSETLWLVFCDPNEYDELCTVVDDSPEEGIQAAKKGV
jgi:hypothetical protein